MISTNRDLYRNIRGLRDEWADRQPPLEEYLRSLWAVVWEDAAVDPTLQLTADRLLAWCEAAFTAPAPAFDLEWLYVKQTEWPDNGGFAEWEQIIQWQIADLWRMDGAGILDQPGIHFGVSSPSGERWYNFDPHNYLECGFRGVFGGYKGDKISQLSALDWSHMCSVLGCGQGYE